jgi:small basic protein (TIGR04137 family)
MSIDKSLKSGGSLSRHNNVLKRALRIEVLQNEERWTEDQSPFGLPKVAHRKAKVGGKDKKKDTTEEGAAEAGETPATPEAEKK